jgi:hypothetical protein
MATTTPNYGWTVPTSTDLVKDGATAIETLGDAIDASLVDLRGGTTGQVLKKASATQMDFEWGAASSGLTLINTTSFSAVSSIALPDNTFSSTYTNYRIVFNHVGTTDNNFRMRMRASGTDNTGTAYYWVLTGQRDTGGNYQYNGTGETSAFIQNLSSQKRQHLAFDIFRPFEAEETSMSGKCISSDSTSALFLNTTMFHAVNTSYDSANFFPASGTITGTVSVYGYAK